MDEDGGGGGREIFHNPVSQPQPVVSIPPCSSKYYKFKQHKCPYCSFRSNHKFVVTRHAESKHNQQQQQKQGTVIQSGQPIGGDGGGGGGGGGSDTDDDEDDDYEQFNVQLEPEFKIFLAGPSKSGKTNFCSQLLSNLSTIAKSKPATTIYVYATWQAKLKEMKQQGLVDVFLQGGHDLEERLKRARATSPTPTLIIFDDMMMEKSALPYIAKLFAIGRHSKLSLIFITQKIFVDDDNVRVIRENSDYYVLMKNPTNVRSVSRLGSQLNTNPSLVSTIFLKATHNKPYSYLFCNVTQQASSQTQYLSELFERDHIVVSYVIDMNNMGRKSTTFHKMYLVSAEKLEKVNSSSSDVGGMGCSKPPEAEEEEELPMPPEPQPEELQPEEQQPTAAAAAAEPPLQAPPVMDVDKGNLKRGRRDIGAGLDDDEPLQKQFQLPPLPAEADLDLEDSPNNNKCSQCDHTFKTALGLKIHTTKMHPLAVKRKVMFAKRKLQKQRPAAVSDSIQQLKIMKSTENRHNGHCYCKICLEEFTSKEAYNRHVQEKHLAGWKVNLAKIKVDDDDDGVSLSDLDNPMEDEEEMSVEKRVESNKKKAKLNRRILSKYKQQRRRRYKEPPDQLKSQKRRFAGKKNKQKAADAAKVVAVVGNEVCQRCQKRFTSASELKEHFIAEHRHQ